MLKRLKTLIALLAIAGMITGCSVTLPQSATGNEIGEKVGTSKAMGLSGAIWFEDDASIKTAAQNGGITKISTVDIKKGQAFGFVWVETIVTGE